MTRPIPGSMHANLPVDLWAEVFSKLYVHDSLESAATFAEAQATLAAVCCVSRTFSSAIEHGKFIRSVCIPVKTSNSSLPGLFLWLERHGVTLQTCSVCCKTPYSDKALRLVLGVQPALRKLVIARCSKSVISLVTDFRFLSECCIAHPGMPTSLDITPLQLLPSLQSLTLLHGCFDVEQFPPHLCNFKVVNSVCYHHGGWAALGDLQSVGFEDSCIFADHDFTHWVPLDMTETVVCVNPSISSLTSLTKLHVAAPQQELQPEFDLKCFTVLTTLQSLTVSATSLMASSGLTVLQQLTYLHLEVAQSVSSPGFDDTDIARRIHLDLAWAAMQSLQQVVLRSDCFVSYQLAELGTVQSLNLLELSGFVPVDDVSSKALADLFCHLQQNRPDVRIELNRSFLVNKFGSLIR